MSSLVAAPGLRFVGADELRANVTLEDLIEPVARAFEESSAGRAQNGLIIAFPGAQRDMGDVYVKSGAVPGHEMYIVKVSPWFAANAPEGRAQGGFVAVFDSRTGHTLALLEDEHYLSDIRTGAAGAVAARTFAPVHVRTATVVGAGTQAYWQVCAHHRERPFPELAIWARSPMQGLALARRLATALPELETRVVTELEPAIRSADLVITATSARSPLVRGAWLRPGQHLTCVGADDPTKCEIDGEALSRARVFVDSREHAAANGDIYAAVSKGEFRLEQIAGEIGDVLSGRIRGRTSPDEITIAKLIGLGAQDLAAAETAVRKLPPHASVA